MRTIKLFVFLCIISVEVFGQKPEIDLDNLFYCNPFHNVIKLWIINDNQAIGARATTKNNSLQKDIVLLDRNGLIIDSLFFQRSNVDFSFKSVKDIYQINDSIYAVVTGRRAIPLKISKNIMTFYDDNYLKETDALNNALAQKSPELILQLIWSFDNIAIGYDRKKSKISKTGVAKKVSNNDVSNFPKFWIAKLTNGKMGEKQYINKENEEKTDDIFIDWKDWYEINNRTAVFSRHVLYHDSTLFFNVTRANRCYTFNLRTNKVSFFTFPEVSKGQSFFYYYDYISKTNYIVKKSAKAVFEVFWLSEDYKKYYKVGTYNSRPQAIISGNVHLAREVQENGKRTLCHYLIPINEVGEQTPLRLDEVVIDGKRP